LRAAVELMPTDSELRIESIEGIPLYNGDVETDGIPPRIAQMKQTIAAADGPLLAASCIRDLMPVRGRELRR
jgi:NAD(P)H-dependent FMN reductase